MCKRKTVTFKAKWMFWKCTSTRQKTRNQKKDLIRQDIVPAAANELNNIQHQLCLFAGTMKISASKQTSKAVPLLVLLTVILIFMNNVEAFLPSLNKSFSKTAIQPPRSSFMHSRPTWQTTRDPRRNNNNNNHIAAPAIFPPPSRLNAVMDIVGVSPEPIHTAFAYATFGPQPFWLLLIFLPNANVTKQVMGKMGAYA